MHVWMIMSPSTLLLCMCMLHTYFDNAIQTMIFYIYLVLLILPHKIKDARKSDFEFGSKILECICSKSVCNLNTSWAHVESSFNWQ